MESSDLAGLEAYLTEHGEAFEKELVEYLEIPSVSTDPSHAPEVEACAGWVAERLSAAGVDSVEVVEASGRHPIVLGEHHAASDAPTLLVYGHYDVQPPDPVDAWETPPFQPTVREGRLYARGATDNKGQNHMHMKALEACDRTAGGIPVNLKIVIEGEEEVGSGHLEEFLASHRDRLSCDAVLLSDTQMFSRQLPAIIVGLRGLVYTEVIVRGPASDLHSGVYGGPVVNPANALAGMIGRLKDERGRVTVPGFYDRVREPTEAERRDLDRLPFDEAAYLEEVGAPALGGEASYDVLELLGYRPTLDVNGLISGFTGEGAKTVLPAEARAKISMRLVPDQDPDEIAAAFTAHVRELAPEGVTVETSLFHAGRPWAEVPEGPLLDVCRSSLEEAFGAEPVFLREGGSIPIIPLFAETFGVQVLPIGFALPGCNLHAPDEWIDLEVYHEGIEALAKLYGRLAHVEI